MQKDNIVLIGMPGVGKSTVGVILAKVLGYQFIDADLVIQEQEKRLLREIIAEEGTEGFIQVENRVNATLEAHHAIIATGGSVVYGKEAMEHLQEIGTVIYLEVAYPELEKRLDLTVVIRCIWIFLNHPDSPYYFLYILFCKRLPCMILINC
jgi:shikimate kinase